MKRILAIDTCGSTGSVELFELATGESLGHALLPGRETQERLLPTIERVLAEAGCAPAQLDGLAVVTGPGSFTGVRIGLAAVKGLSEALNLPVVALSRLAVLVDVVPVKVTGIVHAWIDAGRGDVYSTVVRSGVVAHESKEILSSGVSARDRVQPGDTVAVLEPVLLEFVRDLPSVDPVLVSAEEYRASLRTLVQKAAHAGKFADIVLLDANYLRVPDAELALQARLAAQAIPGAQSAGQEL